MNRDQATAAYGSPSKSERKAMKAQMEPKADPPAPCLCDAHVAALEAEAAYERVREAALATGSLKAHLGPNGRVTVALNRFLVANQPFRNGR